VIYAARDDKGHYTWEGVQYPSVTTVLDLISGEHLRMWYAKMAASESAEIASRIQAKQLDREVGLDQIQNWERRMTAAIRYRDHAAARGSITHRVLYLSAMGESGFTNDRLAQMANEMNLVDPTRDDGDTYLDLLVRESRSYVDSALNWVLQKKPQFISIGLEATTVSVTHGYAGTMDAIAMIDGRTMLLDFKTSKTVDVKKVPMQMEAYRNADFIGLIASGEKFDIPPVDAMGVVHITPMDGSQLHVWEPNDDVFNGFLALREVYGLLNNMPKPNTARRAARPGTAKSAPKAKEKTCPF
jgi:hypothetical protein